MVIHNKEGIFNPEVTNVISITNDLWKAKDVIRVDSLSIFWYIQSDDIFIEDLMKSVINSKNI